MVSIVMTVRERYAPTRDSVTAVLAGLAPSVPVVFVAGKAPPDTLAFLRKTARERKRFTLVTQDRHLTANEARNLGLRRVPRGSDVVFLENDVVPREGWLTHLLKCARETRSDIVAPLIFEGDPQDPDLPLHIEGARFIPADAKDKGAILDLEHVHSHERTDWRRLRRKTFDLIELHCLFIRREWLDSIGLDGRFGGLFAHIDLCFQAQDTRARIMVEPKARVVFLNPALVPTFDRSDLDLFLFQWKTEIEPESLLAFAGKWGLGPGNSLVWKQVQWSLWNKALVLTASGLLDPFERAWMKLSRLKACPDRVRRAIDDSITSRVRRKAPRA